MADSGHVWRAPVHRGLIKLRRAAIFRIFGPGISPLAAVARGTEHTCVAKRLPKKTNPIAETPASSSWRASSAAAAMLRLSHSATRRIPTCSAAIVRAFIYVHIQVKTFVPGTQTCSVGLKAERAFGPNFFWVLAGIPLVGSTESFRYFVVPSADMASNVAATHATWLETPGKGGKAHRDNPVRAVSIPPHTRPYHWSVDGYEDRWELIDAVLAGDRMISVSGA